MTSTPPSAPEGEALADNRAEGEGWRPGAGSEGVEVDGAATAAPYGTAAARGQPGHAAAHLRRRRRLPRRAAAAVGAGGAGRGRGVRRDPDGRHRREPERGGSRLAGPLPTRWPAVGDFLIVVDGRCLSTGGSGPVGGPRDGGLPDDEEPDMDDCQSWMCAHSEASEQEYEAHLRAIIDRDGWLVQSVLGSRRHAPFSYTAGLTEFGPPELVVGGRRAPLAGSILSGVAGYTVSGARDPARRGHAPRHPAPRGRGAAAPRRAPPGGGGALRPRERGLQLVWMGDCGRLPWERGHRGGRGGQPVFGPRAARRDSA